MVMALLTATFLYNGLPDYWGGDGDRWDDNKGCVFAFYGAGTTLRDIIDGAVDDFNSGGDCDTMPEEVTSEDVRKALLDCLSPAGRADYDSGAVSEFAAEYASINGYGVCRECGEAVDDAHDVDCPVFAELMKDPVYAGEEELSVSEDDCKSDEDDDCCDSPICVFLIECCVCSGCGALCDHYVDELCKDCTHEHYPEHFDDVVFLRDSGSLDVFAVFPGIAATVGRVDHITCYAHVGQHSAADIAYCIDCDEVTDPAEYADLFDELGKRDYDLYVVRLDRIEDASYADARADQLTN
jgi:hypothetical protein